MLNIEVPYKYVRGRTRRLKTVTSQGEAQSVAIPEVKTTLRTSQTTRATSEFTAETKLRSQKL